MKYKNVSRAVFISRPNRFIANVMLESGETEAVHVKNTGRCRELLTEGADVYLSLSDSPGRSTRYDLIAAEKPGSGLFNIDSQAPNAVVKEWLEKQDFDLVRPEYRYGDSRIDFYMERNGSRYLLEVKGCTLERSGVGYFPDAPTQRGARHLRELTVSLSDGFRAGIAFVIQAECFSEVLPNEETDPAFAQAYRDAVSAGVDVFFCLCRVSPDEIEITDVIKRAESSPA